MNGPYVRTVAHWPPGVVFPIRRGFRVGAGSGLTLPTTAEDARIRGCTAVCAIESVDDFELDLYCEFAAYGVPPIADGYTGS